MINTISNNVNKNQVITQVSNENKSKMKIESTCVPAGVTLGALGGYFHFSRNEKPIINQQKQSIYQNFISEINQKTEFTVDLMKKFKEQVTDKEKNSIHDFLVNKNREEKLDSPIKNINKMSRKHLRRKVILGSILGTLVGYDLKYTVKYLKNKKRIENSKLEIQKKEFNNNISNKRYWKKIND